MRRGVDDLVDSAVESFLVNEVLIILNANRVETVYR